MKIQNKLLILVSSLFLSSAINAQVPSQSALTLSGVKIGDSKASVISTLKKAGFDPVEDSETIYNDTGTTSSINFAVDYPVGNKFFSVQFSPISENAAAIVMSINFDKNIPRETLYKAAVDRFGKPKEIFPDQKSFLSRTGKSISRDEKFPPKDRVILDFIFDEKNVRQSDNSQEDCTAHGYGNSSDSAKCGISIRVQFSEAVDKESNAIPDYWSKQIINIVDHRILFEEFNIIEKKKIANQKRKFEEDKKQKLPQF